MRPDRPLIVKCTFDKWNKKITFASARNCSYQLLREKVEQCFALSHTSYTITYKDDDGEVTDITTETDLTEAIQYFQAGGDDPPASSAASILSGRSFGSKKINLRVTVTVDYDGPSLSDTSSLVSMDEYRGRNSSQGSFFVVPAAVDPDDDSVTVSSRDAAASNRPQFEEGSSNSSSHVPGPPRTIDRLMTSSNFPDLLQARLDRDELSLSPTTDSGSLMSGDLALKQDSHGKYYYSYRSVSGSQLNDSGDDDLISLNDVDSNHGGSDYSMRPRPSSMHLNWLASQRISHEHVLAGTSSPGTSSRLFRSPPLQSPDPDLAIPLELLCRPIGAPLPPPPEHLTDCSECGILLKQFRYVCSTCGEKTPLAQRDDPLTQVKEENEPMTYPPPQSYNLPSSLSLPQLVLPAPLHLKPLPSLPYLNSVTLSTLSNDSSRHPDGGYELCPSCMESAGVNHALEVSFAPTNSPRVGSSPSSPEDAQRALSQWRRRAPKQKGHLRHGYVEKLWGCHGWEDVEHSDCYPCKCSTCNIVIANQRYKCVSCESIILCKACYSQVHEIHPSHAFLVVPEQPYRLRAVDSKSLPEQPSGAEEPSLKHPGVKCAHCMLDIVGARFHCAICESSIDICSNCESAGLPGNLDSSDGGHNSSHIMIKIPYPLETNELQTASRRAKDLWTGRDGPIVNPRFGSASIMPTSIVSSYARTVVGSPGSRSSHSHSSPLQPSASNDHGIFCDGCTRVIIGVRYQCANCPSLPRSYNLCHACEERSYIVHDPMHAFFKLPRPVHRPIQYHLVLPKLYKMPAGPTSGTVNTDDPAAYLKDLLHSSALCDRCMTPIQGAWFRCAYCAKDLCDACEELDTHNDSHVFLVLKSPVDMQQFRELADLDNPSGSPPLIPYSVYR